MFLTGLFVFLILNYCIAQGTLFLCSDLNGKDKKKLGIYIHTRIHTHIADSSHCAEETNATLKSNYVLCCAVQSHVWLSDPMHCRPPGSSDHGILQARILEFVSMLSSWGSPIKIFFKVLIIQHLVSREHSVFPSGILILSLPQFLSSFLSSFRSWSGWFVSSLGELISKLVSCLSCACILGRNDWLLPVAFSPPPFSRDLSWKKLRRGWNREEAGSGGSWPSLEGVFSGFISVLYPTAAALGTWPNLFTPARGDLLLFTSRTSPP